MIDVITYLTFAIVLTNVVMLVLVYNALITIGQDNNNMLHTLTDQLHKTGNGTNQARGIGQIFTNTYLLHEILNNLTATSKP